MHTAQTAPCDLLAVKPQEAPPRAKMRLGIVGCGAITETAHLPAALSSPLIEVTALVDQNQSRLGHLLKKFRLPPALGSTDYREIVDRVDAVVIAVPNHLHRPIGMDFLAQGIHVLCEKPLAATQAECEQLCQAARTSSRVLAVGYFTRFFPSVELTKRLLENHFLGAVHSFDYEFGGEKGWAPVSGYNLSRSSSGGGVLVANGSHFLDRMLYFFEDVQVLSYKDDSHGGVEANCVASVNAYLDGLPVQGRITLSKTHALRNSLRIVGERGVLELPDRDRNSVIFFPSEAGLRHDISCPASPPAEHENYFRYQLEDFVNAIQSGVEPRVSGQRATRSVALIEECYELGTPLEEPWMTNTLSRVTDPVPRSHSGVQRVLVTGASGLVGSRLCEIVSLTDTGWVPRAFVHSTASAARIARFDLDFHVGDIRDSESVQRALEGCTAVVHLARGAQGVMTRGLENLLRASTKQGVARFVHLSSLAIYGNNPPPESASEAAVARLTGLDYGDEKLRQEHLVLRYRRRYDLPAVILRPPHIWGPSSHFSAGVLRRLRARTLPVVGDGGNPCNLVYVDNVVQAILLALTRPEAVGEIFFVTDKDVVSWEQCLTDYAGLVGTGLPRVSPDEIKPPRKKRILRDSLRVLPQVLFSRDFRRSMRQIPLIGAIEETLFRQFESLPSYKQQQIRARIHANRGRGASDRDILFDLTDNLIGVQLRAVAHSCIKAQQLLGYTAPVSYKEGMELTQAWLRYAHLM